MQVIDKTHLTTQSNPDLHQYQTKMYDEEEQQRINQSVTIYDRQPKAKPALKIHYADRFTLTGTLISSFKSLTKFALKTMKQIKNKEKLQLSENFLSSMRESNHIGIQIAEMFRPARQSQGPKIIPPAEIVCSWFRKVTSKFSKSSQQNSNKDQIRHETGQRDEDDNDIHDQIIL